MFPVQTAISDHIHDRGFLRRVDMAIDLSKSIWRCVGLYPALLILASRIISYLFSVHSNRRPVKLTDVSISQRDANMAQPATWS